MRIKLPVFLLMVFFSLFFVVSLVSAAGFSLNSIGGLDVSENLYSHMWYTGNQPCFSGAGASGETVNITLDGSSHSTTVNTTEQWSWTPPEALGSADHNLVFTSGGETISLTLTTGSDVPAGTTSTTNESSPSALPQSGVMTWTFLVLGLGGLLVIAPFGQKLIRKLPSFYS